jgi:hypothetical protein
MVKRIIPALASANSPLILLKKGTALISTNHASKKAKLSPS